jgi:hypothetical protein
VGYCHSSQASEFAGFRFHFGSRHVPIAMKVSPSHASAEMIPNPKGVNDARPGWGAALPPRCDGGIQAITVQGSNLFPGRWSIGVVPITMKGISQRRKVAIGPSAQ